ncbi:thioredoxin [Lachnospiraceae bacterium RM5]|nr:thioredoxin [Lachnospiraceae bacterium RM5]
MEPIKVTNENFEEEVLKSEKKVLVDFWASWCGPCMMLSPLVDEIANEVSDLKVAKVNVDEENELAEKFNIMSIPCLLVFENGKEVKRSVGFIPKEEIKKLI